MQSEVYYIQSTTNDIRGEFPEINGYMLPGNFQRREFPFIHFYVKVGSNYSQNRYEVICSRCKVMRRLSRVEMVAHLTGKSDAGKIISVKKCIPLLQTSFNTAVGIQANTTELIPNTTTIQHELEEYISHIFLSCGYSFHSVDNITWKMFFNFLRQNGMIINNINRKALQTNTLMLSKSLSVQHEKISKEKMSKGFTILSDSWKSSRHLSTTVVMIETGKDAFPVYHDNEHVITRDHKYYLRVFEKSIESLQNKNIQINKCLAIVTDAGTNIKKAARIFAAKYSLIYVRCCVHALNLLISKICKRIPEIKQLQTVVQDIANAIRRYEVLTSAISSSNIAMIPATCSTRFGLVFYQFDCIKNNFIKYQAAFNSTQVSAWLEHTTPEIKKHIHDLQAFFNDDNKKKLTFCVEYLVAPIACLKMLDSSQEMIGFVFEMLHKMKLAMSNVELSYSNCIPSCAGFSDQLIEERRLLDFNNPLLITAFLVNPYLRESALDCWNQDVDTDETDISIDDERVRMDKVLYGYKASFRLVAMRYKRFIIQGLNSDIDEAIIINKIQQELHDYLNQTKKKWIIFGKQILESDPVAPKEAWDIYGTGLLKVFASLVLSISIRQSTVERFFSQKTLTVSSKRKRLKTSNEEALTSGKLSQDYLIKKGYVFSNASTNDIDESSTQMFKKFQSKELTLNDWLHLANVRDWYNNAIVDNDTGTLVSFPSFRTTTCSNVDDDSLDWDVDISDDCIPTSTTVSDATTQQPSKRQKLRHISSITNKKSNKKWIKARRNMKAWKRNKKLQLS